MKIRFHMMGMIGLLLSMGGMATMAQDSGMSDVNAKAGITQQFCPVQIDEEINPEIYTDYEGERIYFCCPMCRHKFLADPQAYLANLPQFAGQVQAQAAEHEHEDEEHAKISSETGHAEQLEKGMEHHAGHDHEQAEGLGRVVGFLGKFHPVIIHFPIVLVLAAALAELLAGTTHKTSYYQTGRYCIILAAISVVITVPLGWAAGAFATYKGNLVSTLQWHRWVGTATGLLVLALAWLENCSERSLQPGCRKTYRVGLLLAVILVGLTGHLGAMLIYGWDHFQW